MLPAAIFPLLLLADLTAVTHPCADSSLYDTGGDFWADATWEEASRDECETEESLLFSGSGNSAKGSSAAQDNESNRASFGVTRSSGGAVQSTVRQQAELGGWNHRVEIRNDTLTRRRLGWNAGGWRWMAGDLEDPEMPIWPAGLPRRALPRGWRKASPEETGEPRNNGYDLSASRPQGLAAAVVQPAWKAWAARAWNPVETGDEPPWSPEWNLHHASTGISLALPTSARSTGLPWTVSAQAAETRITRGQTDSVAEQLWAASVTSPRENFLLTGAVSKNREAEKSGWALATTWHHRFDNSATVDLTARQRDDAWASSWDPAVTDADAGEEEAGREGWGAGEFRLKGHVPIPRAAVDLETWRAWNPAAGTGREGMRGRLDWRAEDLRVGLTGIRRSARAASGSVSEYRYVEAETRLDENPGFRLAAFRAWNGSGPTRTGIFIGVEPHLQTDGTTLRATSGLRVETDAKDRLTAQGSLGARWAFARGWNLEAAAAAPCYPRWESAETRWRMTINYSTRAN